MGLYETLVDRGYIYQTTNEEKVRELLNGKPTVAYVGVDPTADSLHIGHCLPLILAKYLQDAGHKVIIVLGGATAMIGDPSGKNDMRSMVSKDFVENNKSGIINAISRFIKLDGTNPAIIVNNADWYKGYDYLDFMRDIGVHFNVNKMLSCDAYTNRLSNGGLTFFEMGYMLMQAYDFVYLNKHYDCKLEFGGSDQWANILAGADLGRKLNIIEGKDPEAYQAFTHVLLLNSEGKKMGKTEKGALWVNKDKCSVYDFYQYFYNCDDRDIERLFKLLTYLPLSEISKIMSEDIRDAKKKFAFEVTKLIHGEADAITAMNTSSKLFSGDCLDDVPATKISSLPINIIDALCNLKLVGSKSEGRRMVEQGAVVINNTVIKDFKYEISEDDFSSDYCIIKKGKKSIVKLSR